MATTFQWVAPGTLTTALSTELNSLADSTSDTTGFSALSAEVNGETGLQQYIDLELVLAAQGAARASGAFVAVYIAYAVDSTPNYPDTANKPLDRLLCIFGLDAATTARRLTVTNLPLAPLKFKLYVLNDTGQAFAATGNTLKYRLHNEQGI